MITLLFVLMLIGIIVNFILVVPSTLKDGVNIVLVCFLLFFVFLYLTGHSRALSTFG